MEAAGIITRRFCMGFFDFFRFEPTPPTLTEKEVKDMEAAAGESSEQLELMRRYAVSYGINRVNKAEIQHIWSLAETITNTQVKTIEAYSKTALPAAREAAISSTQKKLNSYAKSLMSRGK